MNLKTRLQRLKKTIKNLVKNKKKDEFIYYLKNYSSSCR